MFKIVEQLTICYEFADNHADFTRLNATLLIVYKLDNFRVLKLSMNFHLFFDLFFMI